MSQNLGLPKLHRSGGSRIFFATFFIDSKLPSRTTQIEMSQKIISKNLAYISKKNYIEKKFYDDPRSVFLNFKKICTDPPSPIRILPPKINTLTRITTRVGPNLHDIVFVHTKKNCEVSKSYNTLQKIRFTQ